MNGDASQPPALHRFIAALLVHDGTVDHLSYLVDIGVRGDARLNGGSPSPRSRALQRLLAEARAEAKQMSRMSRGDIESEVDVTPSQHPVGRMGTAAAAGLLGLTQRTVQRRASEFGGRRVAGVWTLDRTQVEAAAHRRIEELSA